MRKGALVAAIGAMLSVRAGAVAPVGEPVLDPPTLHSLGVYWVVRDDDARPGVVRLEYRKAGAVTWEAAPALLRVDPGPFRSQGGDSRPNIVQVPAGARLFAGSALLLESGTDYELRLTLANADGGAARRTLRARTSAEPRQPAGMTERYVAPGASGGSGTRADPYRGLQAAADKAQPGDLFLIQPGVYSAPVIMRRSGEPGRPIIWRGAGGEVVVEGKGTPDVTYAIDARETHDVWFERLTLRGVPTALCVHNAMRIVVRRCHIADVICGVYAANNRSGKESGFFIADNLLEGRMPWPATDQQWHDLPESRAVWITGTGHDVCFNEIHHFKDAVDLDDSPLCVANDIHDNDLHELFDDGVEMDGSDRNTRCFRNRITNVLCGVSFQPVNGGPVYAFRNVIYNVRNEPFKLHNRPSGAVIVHNTSMRNGSPLRVDTSDPMSNCLLRNNLLVGTSGRAVDCEAPAVRCDFDYDGFAGWSGDVFLKWNGTRYATPAEAKATAPIERHCVLLKAAGLFQGGTTAPADELKVYDHAAIDLRLQPGTPAIGSALPMPGFNAGRPSLGAYEPGQPLPRYGVRPERRD